MSHSEFTAFGALLFQGVTAGMVIAPTETDGRTLLFATSIGELAACDGEAFGQVGSYFCGRNSSRAKTCEVLRNR
jgi:hypothetical protein